jgi:hypothetical protein
MQAEKSCAARRSVTFTLRQAVHVDEHEQVGGAVPPVLAIVALDLPGRGRSRLAHFAQELDRALRRSDHRALRIGRFGIEVEHIAMA